MAAAQTGVPSLVVDAATGQVLLAENATRPWNPASTTKMMTAYVALRAVQAGRVTFDTPLVASARAAGQRPSKIGIRPGQEITLRNALKLIMVKSANDVSVVIAEGIGGSVEGFSELMNAEARRLGMRESRFLNPHGFHEEGHVTSARDLAILTRAMLMEFPEHAELWGIGAVRLGNRVMHNTNGLIGRYPGASGMKTGFVCAAGFNLVATASRGGRTLIAVVLGASSGGDRVVRAAQLLDQGFQTWGGSGLSLASLPASPHRAAPNMRQEICTRRRPGVLLADDADFGGAILGQSFSGEAMGGDALGFAALSAGGLQPAFRPRAALGARSTPSGRIVLGPRAPVEPLAVHLGRVPGSTAVALGPGRGAWQPAVARAPEAQPVRAAPAPALAAAPPVPGLEPLQPLRPAAAAGIRSAAPPAPAGAPLRLGIVGEEIRPGAAARIAPRAEPAPRTGQPRAAENPPRREAVGARGPARPEAKRSPPGRPEGRRNPTEQRRAEPRRP